MLPKEGRSGQLSPLSWKWSFRYLRKRFPHLRERLWAPYTVSEDRKAFIQIPTSWRDRHHFKREDYSPLWTDAFPCCGWHFSQEDNGRGFPALNFVAQLCEELCFMHSGLKGTAGTTCEELRRDCFRISTVNRFYSIALFSICKAFEVLQNLN